MFNASQSACRAILLAEHWKDKRNKRVQNSNGTIPALRNAINYSKENMLFFVTTTADKQSYDTDTITLEI